MSQTTPATPATPTTPASRATPAVAVRPGPVAAHPTVRHLGPVALAVGAVLAATGMGLHLPGSADEAQIPIAIAEAPTRWIGAHLLAGLGFVLVAIGVTRALPSRRGRGARLTVVGALLTAFGATTMALSEVAHGAVGLALTEVDPATSLTVHEAYFAHPEIAGLNAAPILLSLGMILLGTGLLRSRTGRRWVGALLIGTPIAVNLAFGLGLPTWVHGLPIAASMTALAWTLHRKVSGATASDG